MQQKYQSGDVFNIPLGNGTFAICQVVWAPVGDYRNVFSFCVLENGNASPLRESNSNVPLVLNDGERTVEVFFAGTMNISRGKWVVLGHQSLSEKGRKLMVFNLAGALHEGDDFIRRLAPVDYSSYPSMSVFGFELIQTILIDNSH